MIYEWLEKNRKDIDIITSFLVTVIPIIMLYSESLLFFNIPLRVKKIMCSF